MDNRYSFESPFDTSESGEHIISGKVQCLLEGIKQEGYFERYVVE